jgi:hypothetical protein
MQGPRTIPPLTLTLALAVAAWAGPLQAQKTGSVIGAVVDESNLAPLVAAKVSLVDADLSSVTDKDGHFSLEGLPAGEWSVKIEHVSHVSVVEAVAVSSGAVTFVQFTLSPVVFMLDRIQVTTERMSAPPEGSAYSQMEPAVTDGGATAMDLLVARFPSLSITGGDRDGGMSKRVQLRGIRSIMMSNVPALYVDGVRAEISLLANITSSDVRSIRVLRGASASSLYPNASNGVILVETHRGSIGGGQ